MKMRFTVGLVAGDPLYVDDVFLSVDTDDLPLTTLQGTTGDQNLIVFAEGQRADLLSH